MTEYMRRTEHARLTRSDDDQPIRTSHVGHAPAWSAGPPPAHATLDLDADGRNPRNCAWRWHNCRVSQPGGDLTGLAHYNYGGGQHAEGALTYTETPPVGGVHNPVWLNCGIYDTPVPNQNAVHSLEHGAVWITYRPHLPTADMAQLRALVRGHDHALLSPYPGLPAKIVASAWNVQLKLERADDPRLRTFIRTYEGATQAPEPGASCRGGIGLPVER